LPPALRLPAGGGLSLLDRRHRRPAAGGKAHRALPAWPHLGAEFDHFQQAAQAILTTDTVEKTAFARLSRDRRARSAHRRLCKGSGMIHPQLVPHATMLVYILTDAAVEPAALDGYLQPAIEVSFNRISVDGDTSTNDTVLLLASGASGVSIGAATRPSPPR
jgi:glutamate N-acetyltransferase/amino-acid N-acetyltransferase